MRALKGMAEARGNTVTGSDRQGAGHSPANVDGCDLVVYTNAVPDDNCELIRARELGIPTVERATYLGELSRAYALTFAVAGCHGKSTTAAMLGEIFPRRETTVHVGVAGASRVGGVKYFVTEACEYNRSFLHLTPDIGVILNIQYDHPDCYRSTEELTDAYARFCENSRAVLINGDDELCAGLHPHPMTFGMNKNCDYTAEDVRDSNGFRSFTFKTPSASMRIELSVAGGHNVYNALAALATADMAGISPNDAKQAIEGFCGLPRRFERRGIAYGKAVITDYAHHPAEIAATIATAREMFPSVAVVFQPHTYSRTAALLDEFAAALEKADKVILAPVYAAREKPNAEGSSERLAEKLGILADGVCKTPTDILDAARSLPQKAVIFMGAGDVDRLADRFVSEYCEELCSK